METTTIGEIITWFLGGSGLIGFIVSLLTIRWARRKVKGEARDAENEATSKLQEIYQKMVADQEQYFEKQQTYIKEQQAYIEELKKENARLKLSRDEERRQNDEMRRRQNETEEEVRQLKDGFARQGREIKCLRPLACYRFGCKERIKEEPPHEVGSTGKKKTTAKKGSKKEADNGADT